MGQAEVVGPLDSAVGYALKRAATALRSAMDTALRPVDLTVPQYSCLEVLSQRPGLSNAELARAVFVTRQSMNLVLRGLQDRGLVTRPETAPHGRALPSELTDAGRAQLRAASTAVRAVEKRMLEPLSEAQQDRLLQDLVACVDALSATPSEDQAE
ncbi:MarR family transcriptional regulator [Lentzea guizhouensis]|uniref:MarR family transcriptional regulator n=1 Tax=Lentzea guizhouensis TaxID=1586287 RepID=A0A1B2HVF1_9PSEU|nr:MarR family transcriptional regulator [Lentzea guizhouensis]ANZ41701.1 MarR family transcriptional regulator [Lentzea guizhouensis]